MFEFFGNYTDYLDEKAFLQEQSALLEKEKEQASVKVEKVNNKILAFENGHVREFFFNYTDYHDEKAFEENAVVQDKKEAQQKTEKEKTKKKRMSYFEKQEWATIEDEIADLEAKIEEIEAAMLENASDYGQLATLQRDLDAANETLLEKYERYEYLSELEG